MNDKEIKVGEYVRLEDGIIGKVIPLKFEGGYRTLRLFQFIKRHEAELCKECYQELLEWLKGDEKDG